MASGIAIGDYSQAVGRFSLGLGGYAQATGHSSMAIGGVARASGFNSLAMMRQSAANGDFSTAIGTVADAEGNGSFAMGYSSTAKGDQSIAIGAATPKKINNPGVTSVPRAEYVTEDNTVTEGARSIALGTGARTAAGADDSMAFGANARTSGANAVAIGNAAKAQQENTVAIGNQADASAASAFAIGSGAKGTGENAMALGVGANAGANALAIGQGTSAKATGVALGTGAAAEENAAAVGANSKAKEDSLALGAGATSESEGFALGAFSHAETSGMSLGKESNAGTGATAIGLSAKATGENAIVIGKKAQATGMNTISIGTGNIVSGEGSGAIGDPTTVIGHGTYTLGNDNGTIVANNSGVFGNNNTITGAIEGVRVIGNNNTAAAGNVMIMGNGAKASGTDSISIGNGAVAQGEGTQDGTGLSNSTIAIGTRAQALEQGDIVIGRDAKGIASDKHGNTGSGVVVVGADAAAYGARGDVAIGASAETNVKIKQSGGVSSNDYAQGVAIGSTAKTYGTQSVALGSDTRAIGNSSIAIGGDDIDKARGVLEVAVPQLVSGNGIQKTFNREMEANPDLQNLGTAGLNPDGKYANTAAIGDATTSIGILSEAYGTGSTAIGINSLTKGTASTGIGIMARSWGTNSLAMGSQVGAYGNQSTSIGNSNTVGGDMTNGDISGLNSSAVGAENTVYGNNSYAFGGSNTVGSATITTTDSANGHDTDKISTVSGAVLGNQAVALGYQNRVTADNAYAIGSGNTLSGQNGVIIGKDNTVSAANSGVIGNNNDNRHTNITVEDTYAIGNNNGTINAVRSNVFGNNNDLSSTGAEGAHIVGNDNSVTAQGGQVWGNFSKATAADAIVIGSNATADQANSVSLGSNSTTQTVTSTASAAMNGVTKNFAGGTASGTVSVGSSDVSGGTTGQGLTGFKRTVTNVAAGRISDTSTDAINGSQLYGLQTEVERGLNFSGDTASGATNKFNRTLGSEVKVVGGMTAKANLTDGNIGVVSNGTDTLEVKLSKDIHLGTNGSVSAGNTTITSRGITTNGGIRLTNNGIDAGNHVISNVASGGTVDSNAANIGDLKKASSSVAAGTNIASVDGAPSASGTVYTVNAKGAAVAAGTNTHVSIQEDAGTHVTTYTVAADKTTVSAKPAGTDGLGVVVTGTPATDGNGVVTTDYAVDLNADTKAAINNSATNIANNSTNITKLQGGFTVSNEAGTKQDIALGGDAKQNIQFKGEADKIDVSVEHAADGATVTVKADPNLGQNIDISNNSTVNNLKAGFDLKAGSTTSNVALGGTKPTVEFATADDTMTVGLDGTKVTYGIDKTKLAQNITGDMINNINNATTTPITNISAQFGVTAESGNQKTVTLKKDTTPTVKFEGDGKYITSAMTNDGVKYSIDETQLNDTISNNTTVQKNKTDITNINNTIDKGLSFGGDSGAVINKKLGQQMDVKGGATGTLSDNNIGVVSDGTQLNVKLAKTVTGLDSVTAGTAVMGKDASGKSYVTGLDNKDWDVTNPTAVSGRAATEDQLKKLNDTLTSTSAAKTDYSLIANPEAGSNGEYKVTNNQVDLKVKDANHPDAAVKTVTIKDVASAADVEKLDDRAVKYDKNTDGTVNKDKVTLEGGTNGTQLSNVASGLGTTPLKDADGDTLKNAANIGDLQNAVNNTATELTDKGLKFGANSGTAVTNKLGSQVTVKGAGTKDDTQYSGDNIKTKISQDGDGNTTIDVMMDKDITADNVTVGKAGTDGKDGHIGVNGKDGVSGVGIDGKDGISVKGDKGEVGINGNDGISVKGKDGKDGVTIKGEDGVDGVDGPEGHIGLNGKDGMTDIWTKPGAPGLDGADGTTMTRVVYKDPKGTEHQVATLDDGMKYSGDTGTQLKMKLNTNVNVKGGVTDADKLTEGNIGVVADGTDTLNIRLAKELKGLTSVTTGNTIMNNSGVTIANTDPKKTVSLTDGGLNNGGNKITNVADGVDGKDAVNKDQLDAVKAAATTKVEEGTNTTVTESTDPATQAKTYTVDLKPTVTLGTDPAKQVTLDGNTGTVKAGQVTVNGATGTVNNLTNRTWTPGNITSGQAATEDQLKAATDSTATALTDKGLKFGANSGTAVTNKLGSQVTVKGAGTKDDTQYSGDNIKTKISQDGDGNTTIDVMMDKDITADNVTVGKAGTDGKDGHIGVNGKDGVSGVGIDGKDGISVKGDKGEVGINGNDGISVKGKDGKDGVTIKGEDGVDGVDGPEGHIGLNGKDGMTDIWTKPGAPGLDGADGTTMTRVVYKDPKGTEHQVATLDDGMKYSGDTGTQLKMKLNTNVNVKGGVTDADKLTEGNIGVVADGTDTLNIRLAKELKGLTSVTTGNTIMNNSGVTIANTDPKKTVSLTDGGLNNGGNKITNVADGVDGKDAVNKGQLDKAIESAKTTVSAGTNIKVEHTGNGPTDYKVSLNKDVDLGNDGSLKVGDTTVNKDGVKVGDKVTVDKDGFKIKDGPSVTTSGINAGNKRISNVASGSDGIDPSGHKTYNTDTNGANIGDIKDITKAATQELADKGLKFGANSGTAVTNKLGSQVDVVGSEAKADHEYSADNLTTEVSQDSSGKTTITVKMDKAITADNVTVGKAGADGKDGTIGVNGKDGSAVVINGKDGSIGLNGKDGANGMTIKGADGKVGVDGKDGTTRLVYETKDGDKTVVHEVATMDDGMKYAGDDGQTDTNKVISKKLNNTVDIIGGADSTKLTDKNIGVNNVDGKLKVQLSSDITGLNSISTKTVNATESMTIGSGSGATTIKSYKEDGSNATTLDVGGSRISNVAPGEKDTDAATVGQLNQNNAAIANSINNLGGEIQDVGANAAALAGLKPIQYDPLEPTQIMAAVGNYRNSTAAAVGVAHYTREDLMFHAGATVGTKHNMFNAGVTWKFGPASRKAAVPEQYKAGPISASYVMQDEVRALKAENDALRKDNEQTKAALEDVLKRLAALETKK